MILDVPEQMLGRAKAWEPEALMERVAAPLIL